jgi:hypothetical protein
MGELPQHQHRGEQPTYLLERRDKGGGGVVVSACMQRTPSEAIRGTQRTCSSGTHSNF